MARLAGIPDTTLHKQVGWGLIGLAVLGLVLGARATRTFVVESVTFRRSDARWAAAWPGAVFTGRFARHEGHFDPGQRLMNMLLVTGLAALIASGAGLAVLHGGSAFVLLARVHRWATYVITLLLAGHIAIATGIFPGYRGVWRSMHLGGHLPARVARRLWPAWLERRSPRSTPPGPRD